VSVKITVVASSLSYEIDPQAMADALAGGMRDFYAGQLDKGLQPDGSALPRNQEGQPLGRGNGSIVRGWTWRSIGQSSKVGRAETAPDQSGKMGIVIRSLRRRGVQFQGVNGAAAQELARLISDEVDRQHRSAAHAGVTREEEQAST
jgi:hypothetical protein